MIKAVCFDLGDTLVAEETVGHDSSGRAITADVIEGAFEILRKLTKVGYKVALIANDEDAASVRNVITNTGLKDYFDTIAISGELGVEKPDRRIFEVALNSLGVKAENAVMVGNRVDADIVGANRLGMTSVWFKWNDRYPALINACEKKPDFTIRSLFELPNVLGLSENDKIHPRLEMLRTYRSHEQKTRHAHPTKGRFVQSYGIKTTIKYVGNSP